MKREPSGRGSRAAQERANRDFALWQRRHVAVDKDDRLDPHASTPLGVLLLNKQISQREFEAGQFYRQTVIWFRVVSGLPTELPTTLGIHGVNNAEFDRATVTAARRRYASVRRLLLRAGKGVLPAVHAAVVTEVGGVAEAPLRRGLKALCRYSEP